MSHRVYVTEHGDPGDVWMNPPGASCVEADCGWTVADVDTFEDAREALHDHWRTCEHRDMDGDFDRLTRLTEQAGLYDTEGHTDG